MSRTLGAKGKPLTRLQARTVLEALEGVGFDPIRELVKIIPDLGKRDQADILLRLMEYVYPKKTAVNYQHEVNHHYQNLMVNVDNRTLTEMAGKISRGEIAGSTGGDGTGGGVDSGVLAEGKPEVQALAAAGSDLRGDQVE